MGETPLLASRCRSNDGLIFPASAPSLVSGSWNPLSLNFQPTEFNIGHEEWHIAHGTEYFFAKAGIASAVPAPKEKRKIPANNRQNSPIKSLIFLDTINLLSFKKPSPN
jgi:hypothetical protein